ncbi:CPK20, partial [Symbiodinium microadriaticum]
MLIDFGLSKRFDATEKMSQRVGSCYYTAPEVLTGAYDHRCDLWSLGVICYMLLSGSPPFYGKTPDEIHKSTLTKEAEYPERKFKHVSPVGIDFMRRLLVKSPDDRMTADDALRHPFIAGDAAPSTFRKTPSKHVMLAKTLLDSAGEISQSFRLYASLPLLSKLVVRLAASTLSPDELDLFRFEFDQLDQDKSGTLSLAEVQALGSPVQAHSFAELYCEIITLRLPADMLERAGLDTIPEMTYGEYTAAAICGRLNVSSNRAQLAFNTLDG